jgi:hypothetical protein
VAIFTGPSWRIGDLLLPQLRNVALARREDFARVLYLRGYDIQVPTSGRAIHAHGIDVTSCSYSKVPLHTTRDYWFQDGTPIVVVWRSFLS